jgi:hypothetical protein
MIYLLMKTTLIITGWGIDYACVAAMALQAYPELFIGVRLLL